MSTLAQWAAATPEKPALISAETGTTTTFDALEARAVQGASWLISAQCEAGDGIALLLENRVEFVEICLAARHAGLYYTAISTHLLPAEIAYIVGDCGARMLFVSKATWPLVAPALGEHGCRVIAVGEPIEGLESYQALLEATPVLSPLPERPVGRDLLYSSGTTGRPKGVRRPLRAHADRQRPDLEVAAWRERFSFDERSIYLSTAPMYHAAPLRYIMRTLDQGGTCVLMSRFDPELALASIERHRITHSQWVPTMFVRLLKLPVEVRGRHDVSSLRVAVHAAAPCPVDVKQAMLDWWGDVVHEYYAGSEGLGATAIGPLEWRTHPGSVGRAMAGTLHVLDDDGRELPPGQIGTVWFAGVASFAYLNDPDKTRDAYNDRGWASYGDVGHVDQDGYLYLSDRRTDLILSGGVNVYPQEIENALLQHPSVEDAAVIGVPDDELGEVPKAVVQLRGGEPGDVGLAQDLVRFCGERLSRLKLPRSIVFEPVLPRLENGKLLRRVLKDRYRLEPAAGFQVRN
ncbi:acyl-CoA synthetase [soil metagenome]